MTADWRDRAKYPDWKTTKPARWAWEFLRRNPNYRKDWERCVALRMSRIRAGYGSRYDDDLGIYLGGSEVQQGNRLIEIDSYDIPKEEVAIAGKYGINRMPDPGRDEPRSLKWETEKITAYSEFITEAYGQGSEMAISGCRGSAITPEGRYHLPVSVEKAYVEFNLGWPIGPQLKRAKQLLGALQAGFQCQHPERPVSKRKRERHYPTYLQMLDAEEAGASDDEMAALLPQDLKVKGSDLGQAVKYSLAGRCGRTVHGCGVRISCGLSRRAVAVRRAVLAASAAPCKKNKRDGLFLCGD